MVCFLLYLPFSRNPDYFDSEVTPAIIIQNKGVKMLQFVESGKTYQLPLTNAQSRVAVGQKVEVIYELSNPQHAKLNQFLGYWMQPSELIWTIGIFFVLLGVAFATTHRPHPDALKEQLNYKKENLKKYQ
ncbi:MAG: hypothetical protein EBV82_00705 [Chitinophagia bacterium]|nr:hypothetical protein [Chitinophagia bacterium]